MFWPVVFHNIGQITSATSRLNCSFSPPVGGCRKVMSTPVFSISPCQRAFAHVLIIGADVLVQVAPVGDAVTCGHRVGELTCVTALGSGRGTAGGLGRGGCRAFGAAAAACQHCGGQGCRSSQRGGLLDFFMLGFLLLCSAFLSYELMNEARPLRFCGAEWIWFSVAGVRSVLRAYHTAGSKTRIKNPKK